MKNKFSVKIILNAGSVEKVFNTKMDFRKFVVVTADGLPYKMIIDLIRTGTSLLFPHNVVKDH